MVYHALGPEGKSSKKGDQMKVLKGLQLSVFTIMEARSCNLKSPKSSNN